MQFSVLVTRVAEELGLNATTDATKLKAWINEAYKFLAGMREWPWMLKTAVIQTVDDIDTLTATVTAGGTAVTLSATYASSLANDYMIQFAATDDWYLITAHTAGTDALTISPGYQASTNLTAGTCTIRKIYYSLASDVDRVIDMREAVNDRQLIYIDPRTLDRILPDPTATGTPYSYSILGLDSNKYPRATFYPIPDAKVNIHYRYYQSITELSADADIPLLPSKFHSAIVFTALSLYGHPYIDDSRIQSAERRAKTIVSEMIGQVSNTPNFHPVIQPWDQRGGSKPHGAAWPPDYNPYWR